MEKRVFLIHLNNTDIGVYSAVRVRSASMLVLFHGLGCSGKTFRDIWPHDAFSDYSILSFDFPGFGKSADQQDGFSYNMEDQAQVVAAIINELAPPSFHIVAHSMGGAIGLLVPPDLLETIASFTNLEGNLISEDCSLISRQTAAVTFPEFRDHLLPQFKKNLHPDDSKRLFLEEASPKGFYKSCQSLVRWSDSGDLLDRFRQLRCPKAYVHGDRNSDLPVLKRLPDIHTIKIPNSGHFMMNDNPDAFYHQLNRFLRSHQS